MRDPVLVLVVFIGAAAGACIGKHWPVTLGVTGVYECWDGEHEVTFEASEASGSRGRIRGYDLDSGEAFEIAGDGWLCARSSRRIFGEEPGLLREAGL